eukprot:GFUD01118000.1.p1 GENE.GFUD01118000.1~~GFUD01118000.1.p1  ORF type:complete len:136 (+),score=30.65 GFUD01118000.1:78-485(+)
MFYFLGLLFFTQIVLVMPGCPQLSACSTRRSPVCGTDGVTYSNLCRMMVTSCISQVTIFEKHKGECRIKKQPRYLLGRRSDIMKRSDQCKFPCPTEYSPICGMDWQTHTSRCELAREECRVGRDIKVFHEGRCRW